ncbi:unnamed protein product [Urochloa humidicola]
MASGGGYYSPYYQPAPCYYYNYPQRVRGGGGHPSVFFFVLLATVSIIAATTVFAWCESAVESLLDQLRGLLILSPLLLIIAVQLWVATGGDGGGIMCGLWEMVAGDHRRPYGYGYGYGNRYGGGGGSSPWGVAVALVLVLLLVSYHSSFQERWRFPLLGR